MKPKASIICCTYNRPFHLGKALKSLKNQSTNDFEVIVINDGGNDVSEIIERELQGINFQYHSLSKNLGLPAAINFAIEKSKNDYLMFIDDDNEYLPEHVQNLLYHINQHGVSLAYSDSIWKYYDNNKLACQGLWKWDYSHHTLNFQNYLDPVQVIVNKRVIDQAGGWSTDIVVPDWDMWLRLREKTPFLHIKKATACYGLFNDLKRMSASIDNFKKDLRFMIDRYLSSNSKKLHEAAACLYFHFFKDLNALKKIPKSSEDSQSISQIFLKGCIRQKQGNVNEAKTLFECAFNQASHQDPVFKILVAVKLIQLYPDGYSVDFLKRLLMNNQIDATPLFAQLSSYYIRLLDGLKVPSGQNDEFDRTKTIADFYISNNPVKASH